ncbi:hypothetical protein [Flavobacterium tistrianum]|uniref:hypothetical protein n=1 Tax=Flavobacterium tistrianum TaxID=1685414 RepID=UPI000DAE1CF4|nr:hypothetical protein [Flavobacterium tistrianum]KAF2342839.1 hypothetical protein DMB71_01655 [Flavobacterium tistrianum]
MNAKKIARQLELIKYFTLRKSAIYFNINADIDQDKEIENEYVQLSGNYSFKFESIIVDYAKSYSSNLKQKTLQLYFYKKPNSNSSNFELIDDPNGLMTPAIINDYIKDGQNYKRYVFPSHYNHQKYSEWYSDASMDVDKRDTRSYSMNIIVDEFSVPAFNSFLNESSSQWKVRFNTAKDQAILGNFYWLSLYDPRIYQYELSFEDRKKILDYMVYSLYWPIIIDGIEGTNKVDEYELFAFLVTNISKEDGVNLYHYMFTRESSSGKTNLQIYKEKLPSKLYDILLKALISSFYWTKDLSELKNSFEENLLFPIGLYEKGTWEMRYFTYYDLNENKEKGTGPFRLGSKYSIEITEEFSINVKSAVQYRHDPYWNRIEYKRHANSVGTNGAILNYDDVIYVSPAIINQEFNGLNLPYGDIMPIPAFALKWLIDQNEDTQNIINLLERGATMAGVIFPILKLYQAVFLSEIIYESLGLGFTIINNTLGAGLQDQIKKYDESKSTSDHPYRLGQELLSYYNLLSSIYGANGIKNAISEAKTIKNKIKVLTEFENILSLKGVRDDFRSFMSVQFPNDNIDAFNIMSEHIDQIEKEFNRYKYLKNQNLQIN